MPLPTINQYNYVPPKYNFFSHKEKGFPDNLFMGFELEYFRKTDVVTGTTDINHFKAQKYLPKHFYWKRDGSCDVELVTHPFNWPYYLKNISKFDKAFSHIIDHASTKVTNCAFHVHFSKSFFTPVHCYVINQFLFRNYEFFFKLSGRTDRSLRRYSYIINNDYRTVNRQFVDPYCVDKYQAVRITHNTVELRLFKNTLDKEMLHSYLDFYIGLLFYTKGISDAIQKKMDARPTQAIATSQKVVFIPPDPSTFLPTCLNTPDDFVKHVCKHHKLACYLINKRWLKKRVIKKISKKKKVKGQHVN